MTTRSWIILGSLRTTFTPMAQCGRGEEGCGWSAAPATEGGSLAPFICAPTTSWYPAKIQADPSVRERPGSRQKMDRPLMDLPSVARLPATTTRHRVVMTGALRGTLAGGTVPGGHYCVWLVDAAAWAVIWPYGLPRSP